MDTCIICNDDIQNGSKTVELREKGSIGINNASIERGDTIVARSGQLVHLHCRRSYVNPLVIKGLKRKSTSPAPLATPPTLRSEKQFSFQEDCLFCGNSTIETTAKRKLFDVHAVQTTEFQTTVEQICIERKDEWATEVKGRIEFARDLHAVDALYHSSCSTNFRTGKNVPQLFSPKSDKSQIKRGRPNTNDQHFLKVLDFLEDNDDEQLTIKDLVDRMKALCGDEAYSQPYMKQKVQEHYGSSILITELNGKQNVVTFRQTASTIIHNFYTESKLKKSDEDHKLFLLKTAAALIKSEIRSMPVDKNYYPSNNDILSHEKHIPESLAVFLKVLFSEKDASLKISSIGQAIMQATRPRLVIVPLQLGLAIQMHHNLLLETIVVTPLDSPKINLMNSELFWGTYRSNLYFGMKTRSPKSPVIGLMWFEESLYEDAWDQNEPEIRHWCDQKHNIQKYGWLKHDGNKFGIHEVVENTFMFNTKFVKRSGGTKGGDWTARITAWPKEAAALFDITKFGIVNHGYHGKIIVSFLVYLAVEDDGKIENGKSDIFGSSLDLDDFRLKFTPTLLSKKVKVSLMTGHCSNFSEIEKLVKAGLTISFWNSTHYYKSFSIDKHSPNVVVYQVTAEVPVQFDIVFRSLSFKQERRSLTGNVFTQEFEARGYDTKSIDFAKAALSNLLGEISYFHGSSLVKSKHNKKPIDYWSSSLYTSIPSRSSFPRGFLWNAGFDNILISLWNSTISEEIISSWLDLVNIEGWIPRELILGDEAKAKTPEKFIVQENDNANPPTLFLSIHNLMVRNLTNTDFLRKIFPRLKVWLNWINSSQAGNDPYTYYWRRRENNTTKLNPLTPSLWF
ncbi:MOGS [Mytilus edulis]|uniref:Mannosyl-oligosaccharide glucosidase n=1 Tax=Mytilus edulis TaxID=6550 RepID=A0A8S3THA7_MYTED|nr:MOGS [Mytilus edulis]